MSAHFGEALTEHAALATLATTAATLLVGGALYGAVERPGLRLREHLLRGEAERAPPR